MQHWRGQLHKMELETLLARDFEKAGLSIKKSLVRHPHALRGNSAAKPFWQGMCAGNYYINLVYSDQGLCQPSKMKYGQHIIEVMRESFQKCEIQLCENVVHRGHVDGSSAILCCALYQGYAVSTRDKAPKVELCSCSAYVTALLIFVKHDLWMVQLISNLTVFWVSRSCATSVLVFC